MLISHAVTLAEARSYVAALADRAQTDEASVEYERVLLQLDWIHGDYVPGISEVRGSETDVLYAIAEQAIEDLVGHGIDALQVELVLDMLDVARTKDGQ